MISVPTRVAKYASWFQGKRYPVNPKPRARARSPTPESQVSSRGGRYAFRSHTLKRCTKTVKIIRFAAHEWIERMSHPNSTSAIRNWTDS